MDRTLPGIDRASFRLRRARRMSRRRMRIDGVELRNGVHTDGRLTVVISGLGDAAAGAPHTFDWRADRPIALVIVRAGVDGEDVSFEVGPRISGRGTGPAVGDGSGIRYVAFCYDAAPERQPLASRSLGPRLAGSPA
jgi:hypothetical protein